MKERSATDRYCSWCQRLQPPFRLGCSNLKNVGFFSLLSQTICLPCPQSVLKRRFNSRISRESDWTCQSWLVHHFCLFMLSFFLSHGYFWTPYVFAVTVMLFLVLRLIMASLTLTDIFTDHIPKITSHISFTNVRGSMIAAHSTACWWIFHSVLCQGNLGAARLSGKTRLKIS